MTGSSENAPSPARTPVLAAAVDPGAARRVGERLADVAPDLHILTPASAADALRSAFTGEAPVRLGLLVADAAEGVDDRARRAVKLLERASIRRCAIVVDAMDEAFFEREQFELVLEEVAGLLASAEIDVIAAAPCATALDDEGASEMAWRETDLAALGAQLQNVSAPAPFRFWVRASARGAERTEVSGPIVSGAASVGDALLISPSNVPAIALAVEGEANGDTRITLDRPILVDQGELISHKKNPPTETDTFRSRIYWSGSTALASGSTPTLRVGTASVPATVEEVDAIYDAETLEPKRAETVEPGGLAEVVFSFRRLIAIDPFDRAAAAGRFLLEDDRGPAGGGLISMEGYADQRGLVTRRATNLTPVSAAVTPEARARRNGHKGGVIWLTGLSGSGKSTLAMALEQRLFERGFFTYVLDGDNVRYGLSADLGFTPEDRAENIRRVGELAALFAQAGVLVVTSFISPYRSDRARARRAAGDAFHEIFVEASLAECERRDPKGLYARARAGEIQNFTGVSAPYEPPKSAECVVKTEGRPVEDCVDDLFAYVSNAFRL